MAKEQAAQQRTMKVIGKLGSGLAVSITTSAGVGVYVISELPTQIGGRGFQVQKLKGDCYDVLIGVNAMCHCGDHLGRHRICKHIACVETLCARGLL